MKPAVALHEAILANSPIVVRECLETGADPNVSPVPPLFSEVKSEDDEGEDKIPAR